MNQNTNCGN